MTKDLLLREIAETILANEKMTPEDWTRIVVRVVIEDERTGITGLVYSDDRAHHSVVPRDPSPVTLFVKLRTCMAKEDKHHKPWLVSIVQLDRHGEDVAMDFQFEYDNADRWAITPDNLEEIVNQFRPPHRAAEV